MHEPLKPLGTQDLEAGLRPSNAREFALIAAIVVVMLLVFNSEGLAAWTQRLPSSETTAWLSERASEWHERMERLGTAQLMERLKLVLRQYTPET